jgi:hypothetical protein
MLAVNALRPAGSEAFTLRHMSFAPACRSVPDASCSCWLVSPSSLCLPQLLSPPVVAGLLPHQLMA